MTFSIDPKRFRKTAPFIQVFDAVPAKGWQTVAENAAAAGVSREVSAPNLRKAAKARILVVNSAISPMRYRRATRAELGKDELAVLKQIDEARLALK